MGHCFHSKSEDVEGNRVQFSFLSVQPWIVCDNGGYFHKNVNEERQEKHKRGLANKEAELTYLDILEGLSQMHNQNKMRNSSISGCNDKE